MKKIFLLLILVMLTYILIANTFASSNIIPDDAIRIRVIANSNSDYDQSIKIKVKNSIQKEIYNILKNTTNVEEARKLIKDNINNLENNVKDILIKEEYELPFTVNYGLNYFPSKEFKGIIYKEGYYESLVITLGSGLGNNWWCVLFPPLCSLEAEESTDVEYTTMVKEIMDKYF